MLTVEVGRSFPGVIGGTRETHLFHQPDHYPGGVYTLCGTRYWSGDIEWLNIPIPVETCADCLEIKADVEASP